MASLYHYTSLDTFFNIIKNQSIHLGNTILMNDPDDNKCGVSNVDDVIKEKLNITGEISFDKNLSINYKKEIIDDCYIFCFTGQDSKDDLSQWRSYGQNGTGISIEFDQDIMDKFLNSLIRDDPEIQKYNLDRMFRIHKCLYDKDIAQKSIEIFINPFFNEMDKNGNIINFQQSLKTNSNRNGNDYFDYLTSLLRGIIKPEKYAVEDEYRIFLTDCLIKKTNRGKLEKDFKISSYGLTPYYRLSFGDELKNIIKSVTLGPTFKNLEENTITINSFLKEYGFNFKVIPSRVKMRS